MKNLRFLWLVFNYAKTMVTSIDLSSSSDKILKRKYEQKEEKEIE